MKRTVILLLVVILLYLIPSAILQAVYGPSYGFMSGQDYWAPDGHGGWVAHGHPTDQAPDQPSANVPLALRYLPIFLPAAVLILFYLTPLSKLLQEKTEPEEPTDNSSEEPKPPDSP